MIRKLSAFLVAWLCLTVHAVAGVVCSLPFTLTNGTIADATQVMANYNALVTCLGNAAAAGANSDITSITGLTTPLSVAQGGSSVYLGGTSTGSANAQVVASTTPIGFSLSNKSTIYFIAGFTNTGATQLNINSTGLTNVFRMSPSGPQALTGGEIVTNDLVVAVYDGVQFELVSQHAQFGGFGPITNLASAAPDLGTISSHNVNITGNTTITSFGSSCSATFPMYQVTFAGALTLTYNAVSLILPTAANITTAANDTATVLCVGANARVVSYNTASGTSLTSTVNVQSFLVAGGTWTRPAGASFVRVFLCGAGGSGGGGSRAAAATATNGGSGAGGGYCQDVTFKAADAGASQTMTIGAGPTGGAGATANGNAGIDGTVGASSTFGALLTAFGGGAGKGGPTGGNPSSGGGGGGPQVAGGIGIVSGGNAIGGSSQFGVLNPLAGTTPIQYPCVGAATANTAVGSNATGCPFGGAGGGASDSAQLGGGAGGDATAHGPGGGAGGSITVGNATSGGGAGGRSIGCPTAPAGGAAGSNPGGSTAADFNYHPGCGGGGGGASTVTAGGAGGAGTSAGGGGGGGAGQAVNGGAGGAGGNGLAIIFSW